MITAHVERLVDNLEELKPFFDPHWHELALDRERVPLDPQYEVYLERDRRGEVLCVVLRDAGAIVAYFVGFIAPGLHYRTCLTLQMDIFWLDPDYRDGDSLQAVERDMISMQLFDAVEHEGRRRGVQRAFYGSKLHKDAAVLFVEGRQMIEVERYFTAWWGE
jgi:hypothetical protein